MAVRCIQEDLLANQLGSRAIRDKLNVFLWRERSHVEVRELVDWCRKYLYLPRITNDQVILDALVNSSAVLAGESTFYLADSFNEGSGRYQGLRPQQSSSNKLPSLISLIVKEDVARRQAPESPPSAPIAGVTVGSGSRPEVPPAS